MKNLTCGVVWYYSVLYAILLMVHVANARYFHFFENHLNIGVTAWFGFVGDTAGLIFGDATNWWFVLIALVLSVLYIWALVALNKCFAR